MSCFHIFNSAKSGDFQLGYNRVRVYLRAHASRLRARVSVFKNFWIGLARFITKRKLCGENIDIIINFENMDNQESYRDLCRILVILFHFQIKQKLTTDYDQSFNFWKTSLLHRARFLHLYFLGMFEEVWMPFDVDADAGRDFVTKYPCIVKGERSKITSFRVKDGVLFKKGRVMHLLLSAVEGEGKII